MRLDEIENHFVRYPPRAEGFDHERHGACFSNCVRDLDLEAIGEARCDHVLGDVTAA